MKAKKAIDVFKSVTESINTVLVHVSGNIKSNQSIINDRLKYWNGSLSGHTDKGIIFKFKDTSDAKMFVSDINGGHRAFVGKNVFAEITS